MLNEEWFVIPKFPEYEINHALEVRHRVFKQIKKAFCDDGYLKINLTRNKKKHKPYLHQLVAWVFVPNPENKPEIHHIDCDSLNNHWSNLQWVTRAEHRALSKQNGQIAHKLTPADVVDIRNSYLPARESELANKYGVKDTTIYLIATGQVRSDVNGGIIHETKGVTKKIINIKTNEIYNSVEQVSVREGISIKTLRRQLSGERYNDTNYRYLGEEDKSKIRPAKVKKIPFMPYSFGVTIPRKQLVRSKNKYTQWKKVIQCDLIGNELAVYKSIREAARAVGAADHKQLQKLLNGRRGRTYKQFLWKYA